jgi:hypothetical protein
MHHLELMREEEPIMPNIVIDETARQHDGESRELQIN